MDFSGMMRQAQNMQKRMEELQKKLDEAETEGISGGGLVRVILSGKGELKKLELNASLCVAEEKDVLEDLVIAAHNDALKKISQKREEEMGELMSGLKLPPGINFPM